MSALTFLARRFVAGETADAAHAAGRLARAGHPAPPSTCWARTCSTATAARRARRPTRSCCVVHPGRGGAQHLHQAHLDGARDRRGLLPRDVAAGSWRSAREVGGFVRIDMEGSKHTQRTIDAFRRLRKDYDNVGIVLQACSPPHRAGREGGGASGATACALCKGAYKEPPERRLDGHGRHPRQLPALRASSCSTRGNYPAIATHDEGLVRHAIDYATRAGIPRRPVSSSRCCTACARAAGTSWWRDGLQRPHLRALRDSLDPLLLPPPARAQGERLLRPAQPLRGIAWEGRWTEAP